MKTNLPVVINSLKIALLLMLTSILTFLSVRYYDHINSLTEFKKMKTEYTTIKNQEREILLQQKQIAEKEAIELKAKYESDIPYLKNEVPK